MRSRAFLMVLALVACVDPGPTSVPSTLPTGPVPPPLPGLPPGAVVGVTQPSPEKSCSLGTAHMNQLCGAAARCPVLASWRVDCEYVRRVDLAVSNGGEVLAVVDGVRGSFALQTGLDREPSLTHVGPGGLVPAFTQQQPPEPRLVSPSGLLRRTESGWQPAAQGFAARGSVVGAAFTQGEMGFALQVEPSAVARTLWLVGLTPSQEPAVMIAQGTIDYQQLLVTPSGRQPVVVYAERRGGEIRIRAWDGPGQASRVLHSFEPRAGSVGFSASLSADGRPLVQYNDDGNAVVVGGAPPVPVFAAEPATDPLCNRCGDPDYSDRYNKSEIGERVSQLHALAGAGPWSAMITGPTVIFCEVRGCANQIGFQFEPLNLRLRNVSNPAREVTFVRPWSDPILLASDDNGLLYLAVKSPHATGADVFVLDPSGI